MSRRLLLGYLSLTLLVLLVLEVPLGITIARRERDRLATELERDAFVLASLVEDVLQEGGTLDTAPIGRYVDATGARVVVVDSDGVGVLDTDAPAPGRRAFASRVEFSTALSGEVSRGTRRSSTLGTSLFYVAVPVASGGTVHGAVRVTYPSSSVDARVRRSWLALAGVAGVSLLAATAAGLALARSVSRPLRRLEAAADALGEGDLTARAVEEGPPEVRSLARSFNDMGARLEELVASQDAFVADASHQLRNPLTALRLRLENLAAELPGDQAGEVGAALEEVGRLSRTVAGLLTLARADRDSTEPGPVDVAAALEDRRQAWVDLAAERDIALGVDTPAGGLPPALVHVDRFVQILDNLLANAVDAAPPGSIVRLAAETAGERVAVHVVDHGPGMSEEERLRSFDRFWRADGGSRPASLGGTGLGLAIVRKLALADGAEVSLEAAPGGGIDAVVRFRSATSG